jgi:hypothetical protein
VRERTKDTWGLWRKRALNPESNVQFGEGGAGTFSDGKLYSQIKDPRHLGRKVMQNSSRPARRQEILYVGHPHIGTFKLVKVVENLREQIIALGGEIRFEQRVTDVLIEEDKGARHLRGLKVLNQATGESTELRADHVVMALGHSARDTFAMLYERGVAMEAKPFSVGFRIEHPQGVIDRARWGRHAGHPLLGAADYKLVHHASNGRAVYSFCMCPGGTVVAATSEPGRVVTNGMSQYSRNERNANAGMVVGIDPRDYPHDPARSRPTWAPPTVSRRWAPGSSTRCPASCCSASSNRNAYVLGGARLQRAGPAGGRLHRGQAVHPAGRAWSPRTSPACAWATCTPPARLRHRGHARGLPAFGRKIKGFDMHDAVLTGVETRTSSPLKIPRGDDLQSLNTAACTRRAKAPATRAASCRPGWTASRWAKPWRARIGAELALAREPGHDDGGHKAQHDVEHDGGDM